MFKGIFKNGLDITPYLSRQILCHYGICSKKSNSGTIDKDIFLNGVGVHHLHLKKYRSSELFFVKVSEDKVYFIDILKHNDCFDLDSQILNIINLNWPDLLKEYECPIAPTPEKNHCYSGHENQELRKSGFSPLQVINGKVHTLYPVTVVTAK